MASFKVIDWHNQSINYAVANSVSEYVRYVFPNRSVRTVKNGTDRVDVFVAFNSSPTMTLLITSD